TGERSEILTAHVAPPFVDWRRPRHQSPPKSSTATPSAAAAAGTGAPLEQPDTRPRLALSQRRVAGTRATGPAGGGVAPALAGIGAAAAGEGAAAAAAGASNAVGASPAASDVDVGAGGCGCAAGATTGATVGSPGGIRPKGSP